jgi:hypothetical protein
MANTNLGLLTTGLIKQTISGSAATLSTAVPGTDYPRVGGSTPSTGTPVSVTTALNKQTFIATDAVEYNLPTGDLSSFVAAGVEPLRYTFIKSAAGTITIDPDEGNVANSKIAGGSAKGKMTNSEAGETYASVTVQLYSSAASVNLWAIVGAHGTWVVA